MLARAWSNLHIGETEKAGANMGDRFDPDTTAFKTDMEGWMGGAGANPRERGAST